MQYGPIDLLIDVDASADDVLAAHDAARSAFYGVLEALVSELPLLRTAITNSTPEPEGTVAKLMWQACLPYAHRFVTPMAAVAGSVADYLLQSLVCAAPNLERAWVNNGGDIALWLSPSAKASVAVFQNNAAYTADLTLSSEHGVGGIATSGWPGRSHSLGIADTVTVLAKNAASADVAATLIANAVQLPNTTLDTQYVQRRAANQLQPDSDLLDTPVTVAVSELPKALRQAAVQNGLSEARQLMDGPMLNGPMLNGSMLNGPMLNKSMLVGVFIDCQGHCESLGECA